MSDPTPVVSFHDAASDLLPVGIHFGIPEEQYLSDPGYNQSTIKKFGTAKTPAHFRWDEDHPPDQDTSGLRIGNYVDCAVFSPKTMNDTFAVWYGGRRAGKDWEAFKEAEGQRTILTEGEYERGKACVAAMLAHDDAASALKCSNHQVTIIATHPLFGFRLKGRLDMLPKKDLDWAWDWKSGCDASSAFFHNLAGDKGYDVQAEFYLSLLEYAGQPTGNFGFFVGETEPPHGVDTHYVIRDSIELREARRKIDDWLVRYHKCKTENVWPCYDTNWKRIRFKPWRLAKEHEQEVLV